MAASLLIPKKSFVPGSQHLKEPVFLKEESLQMQMESHQPRNETWAQRSPVTLMQQQSACPWCMLVRTCGWWVLFAWLLDD